MKTTTIRASDYALAGSRYSLRTVVRKTLRNTSGQVLIDLDVHGILDRDLDRYAGDLWSEFGHQITRRIKFTTSFEGNKIQVVRANRYIKEHADKCENKDLYSINISAYSTTLYIPGEDPINVRIRHTDEDEEICVAAGLERVQNRYPVVFEKLFFLPAV